MVRKKRTEITTETTTLWLVRTGDAAARESGRCARCAAGTFWLAPKSAAAMTGLSARRVYRLLEEGAVHSDDRDGDEPRICSRSLLKELQKGSM